MDATACGVEYVGASCIQFFFFRQFSLYRRSVGFVLYRLFPNEMVENDDESKFF